MIYLDNAATTLHKPPEVAEAVAAALTTMGNAARGAHSSGLSAARAIYDARVKVAELLGCRRADHVVFTANSTQALNIAIRGLFPPGAHLISTDLEHNSVLRPLYQLEREGLASLSFVPADRAGRIDEGEFEALITPETRGIVCTHASNLTGNMVDLARVGEIARRHGLIFVVDASQTAGAVPLDMEALGIDVLCFTGHKGLMGPQGTGGMCIREGVEIRPLLTGGTGVQSYRPEQPPEYPTRLEAGTMNGHGLAGLSAALDFIRRTGVETIARRERMLMERFWQGVAPVEGVTVYGDFSGRERAAIVALNLRDYDSAQVSDVLFQDYGIATRPGAHCAPRMHRALGTQEQGAVRFSFSWYNTEEEIDQAIQAVRELARE